MPTLNRIFRVSAGLRSRDRCADADLYIRHVPQTQTKKLPQSAAPIVWKIFLHEHHETRVKGSKELTPRLPERSDDKCGHTAI